MTGPLSKLGHRWQNLVDVTTDWSVNLLHRAANELADGIDRAARRDVEGANEWRVSCATRFPRQ